LKIFIFAGIFVVMIFLLNSNPSSVNGSSDSSKTDDGYGEPTIEVDDLKLQKVFEGFKFPTSMAFLGPDDILVLEKNNGTVQRLLNGKIVEEPVLDVSVANYVERGMLGITIDNKNTLSKYNDRHGRTPYIFVYYTESSDEKNILDKNGEGKDCVMCIPIGHRLYRYELHDDKLVNPQLILDIPSNPGRSGSSHIGGALVIGPDNNIYLTTGDGESCQDNSCKDGIQNKTINAQTANVLGGRPPEGRGGILRVDQDGRVIKGIFSDKHPLNLYYAYGIRNSFGIDFDPVTGNLWDTENGPGFGDEINLVKPGFNSGWIRIQGIWPINNYELLDSTPKEKGYFGMGEIGKPDNLIKFDRMGKYSSPELAWNRTVGLTAIKFLDSDKLGRLYKDDLFVGDVNGNLYHFDLNPDRTGLELKGKLLDKVANSHEELEHVIIGKKFHTIVDIESSTDGYLYILSYNGSIYKLSKDS
jgi:glucose/arabinose dehydrogenase